MPLDFCIGIDGDTATGVSFQEQPHVLIFTRFGLPENEYQLFARLRNYWNDAKYEVDELEGLMLEIDKITRYFSSNPQLIQQLKEIRVVCEKATRNNFPVWVFCD